MKSYELAKQVRDVVITFPTREELKAATGYAVGDTASIGGLVTKADGLQGQYEAVTKGGTPDDDTLLDGQGVDWQLIASSRLAADVAANTAGIASNASSISNTTVVSLVTLSGTSGNIIATPDSGNPPLVDGLTISGRAAFSTAGLALLNYDSNGFIPIIGSDFLVAGARYTWRYNEPLGFWDTLERELDPASASPTYMARAWADYEATTQTLRGNGNISSVTRHSAGSYTFFFTIPMPDTNYACLVNAPFESGNAPYANIVKTVNKTVNSVDVITSGSNNGGSYDSPEVSLVVFR